MSVAQPVRSSNPIERDFYAIDTAINFLGRTAKGRYDTIDPAKALKEVRAVEAAIRAFKATCRQDIIDRKAAAKEFKVTEGARITREAAIVASREADAAARAARNNGLPDPDFVRDAAVDGLVAMAIAAAAPEPETVEIVAGEVVTPKGISRLIPSFRRKVAA